MTARHRVPHPAGDSVPALHNSGPGPMAVYRTGTVGQEFRLDIAAAFMRWEVLPAELRAPMAGHGAGSEGPRPEHFVKPEVAERIARFLHDALEQAVPVDGVGPVRVLPPVVVPAGCSAVERACAAIATLAGRVAELGWLAPVHGLARSMVVSTPQRMGGVPAAEAAEWPWLPPGDEHRALRYAWLACAVSYLSPPLILWTRPPSLAWWRGDQVVALRWFGPLAQSGRTA